MKKLLQNLKFVLLFGFIVRILFAFSYDTGDTGAVCNASNLFLQGKEVYAAKDVYFSPPPFTLHVAGLSNYLGKILGLPCSGMWKLPVILADIGIGYLLYLIAQRHFKKNKTAALIWTKWYIFNPIAIFASGFHGQQESFWLFFVLLSWYVILYKKTLLWATLSTAVAVSYKLPTVLLLPGLLISIKLFGKKILFILIIAIFFSLSLLPEILTSTQALINKHFFIVHCPGSGEYPG